VKQLHRSWTIWGYRWTESGTQSAIKRRAPLKQPFLESLESRQLLTASISEFPVNAGGDPTQITVAPNNDLWVTEPTANALENFDTSTETSSSTVNLNGSGGLANASPPGLTATGTGSSGTIWFTVASAPSNFQLGQLNLAGSSSPTFFSITTHAPSAGITSTSDGADIWVTLPSQNEIVSFTASNPLENTAHPLSPANIAGFPSGFSSQITADSNGNLWFTEPGGIGMLNAVNGAVIQVALPTSGGTQIPSAIAAGPNNTIWFTESVPGTGASAVGVINATSQTYVTEFVTPTSSQPDGITAGPDGNIWFTEGGAGAIGMINVNSTTNPTLDTLGTPIAIPTLGHTGGVVANPAPRGIISGPGNSLWFADSSGAIGKVTPSTTNRFMVTSGPPLAATAGSGFGLVVSDGLSANNVNTAFNGSVTVTILNQANVPVGTRTQTAVAGVATFSNLTLDTAGGGYTIEVTSSAAGAPPSITTSPFIVVAAAPTQLILNSQPPASVNAGTTFPLTAKLEDRFDNLATNFSGTVIAALASNPGGSTLSGATSVVSPLSANPGFAIFNLSLNQPGNGYTLTLSEGGLTAGPTTGINVLASSPTPTPTPPAAPTIIGETAVFTQKTKKVGKKFVKVGKPVLSGYKITFSTAMNQGTLGNAANYVMDTVVPVKKTRKKPATTKVTPVGFSVNSVTPNSVILKPAGTPFSTKAGMITVLASSGVESTAGAFMAPPSVTLPISKGGKSIS
jgi:streptogramin lyase